MVTLKYHRYTRTFIFHAKNKAYKGIKVVILTIKHKSSYPIQILPQEIFLLQPSFDKSTTVVLHNFIPIKWHDHRYKSKEKMVD